MRLSCVHLHLFLLKINLYEPGIVKIIENIVEDLIKFYHELTMTQIRVFLKLKEKVFDHRFSITAVRNLESVKVNEMIKYIDSPRDCIFFKHSEYYLLDTSTKHELSIYIYLKMLLYKKKKELIEQLNFRDFKDLTIEKIKNMTRLIKSGIKQPYAKWYINENSNSNIKKIIKLKKAGFSDLWCAEPLRNNFTDCQISEMIYYRKKYSIDFKDDKDIYWMVK